MSMQMRMNPADSRFHHPDRDVAWAFVPMVTRVAARLEDGQWPALARRLTQEGVTQEDLGRACAAFIQFVAGSLDQPEETMAQGLERVGWFQLPELAQIAYLAYLGTVISGYFWHGVREVTFNGEGPLSNLANLRAAGAHAAQVLTQRSQEAAAS